MNTWEFSRLTKLPMRLWRRFHIWRAMRKYALVKLLEAGARVEKAEADALMVKHAQPPCPLFDRLDKN